MTTKQVYEIVKTECRDFDAIYEDYLITLVGTEGLQTLRENRLVEPCGVVYGRRLYALCDFEGEA